MTVTARKYNPGFLSDDELVASFCVRTGEFASMVEVLRDSTGKANTHQIVIGPRGSGKTSLLLRVAAEIRRDADLSSRFFPIVFAEESYEVSTAGEFWLECLSRLADQAPRGEDGPDLHRTYDGAAANPGRQDARGPLPRRSPGFCGSRRQASRIAGREPEHDVQGYRGRRCRMAAAPDAPERSPVPLAGERNQPVRRNRQTGPRLLRPVPGDWRSARSIRTAARLCGGQSLAANARRRRFGRCKFSPEAARDCSPLWRASAENCRSAN